MQLTNQGLQLIEDVARRHYLSVDAVTTMLSALANGGGTMAQFSHPEFGGSGQWMQGGMTMVGDMFNNNLKAKVDNLCYELSGLMANQPLFVQVAQNQPQNQGYGGASLLVDNYNGQWWPGDLGSPSSTGSQNNLRYAIFPSSHRLVLDLNGQVTVYDTLDHQIGGVGQQQGSGASFTFTSQYGLVPVSSLPIVNGLNNTAPPTYAQTNNPAPMYAQNNPPAPVYAQPDSGLESDIFAKIERLAELRQKGIVSDAEFAAKKAELLSRI